MENAAPQPQEKIMVKETDRLKLEGLFREAPPAQSAPIGRKAAQDDIPDQVYKTAHSENMKREFTKKVLEARAPVAPEPPPPQPVHQAVLTQTQLEMEAGRKRVAEFEEAEAKRPKPVREDTGVTPVFRPADYVPNMNKGQVGGRNL